MAAATVAKDHKVRYAVVGVGWISQAALLPGVEHTGNSEIVALVTSHEQKAEEVGEKYGIKKVVSYAEYGELLASGEIDAAYLATPNFDHLDLALQTLDAGVHLLIEKPMAVSVDQCEQMIAAAKRSGAKLMVAYRLHFEPGTLKAIERVRDGDIGTVRFFNSSFAQQVNKQNHRAKHGFWAGPVPDMGPYPLNMVRNLFGAEPIRVAAVGVNTDPDHFTDEHGKPFDDTVAVTLTFPAERVASFSLSYSGADVDEYRIVGSKGDLFSNPAYQVASGIKHEMTVDKKKSGESFKTTDHFGGELKYFSDCIREDRHPEPDGEEGMLDVRVLEAIEKALLTGQVQVLAPYIRKRRPTSDQVQELSKVKEPELVGSHKPSEGQ